MMRPPTSTASSGKKPMTAELGFCISCPFTSSVFPEMTLASSHGTNFLPHHLVIVSTFPSPTNLQNGQSRQQVKPGCKTSQ